MVEYFLWILQSKSIFEWTVNSWDNKDYIQDDSSNI